MQLSQLPRKFNLPFGSSAGGGFTNYPIPDLPPGTPGLASLQTGFPPVNFTPISAGGIPPAGADFNAILFQITSWDQWIAAGGPIFYDATFQTAIGGYPNGAVVQSAIVPGNYWQSTVDNNTSNPDTGGANWISPSWAKGTGEIQWRPASLALPNNIILNGTAIGSAASGSAQLASATAQFIFQYLWNNFSNTLCPVNPGGRGANALADFNANKNIATLDMRCASAMGVDAMGSGGTGFLNSVPVQSGSITLPGSVVGENLHTLITAELAVHSHPNGFVDPTHQHGYLGATTISGVGTGATIALSNQGSLNTNAAFTGQSITNANAGSGSSHNTVHRSMLGYWFMHL